MSLQSSYFTLTNVGGIGAWVDASIVPVAAPAWPPSASCHLTYISGSNELPVVPGTRIGPILNLGSMIVKVYVETGHMLAASTPYSANAVLNFYRAATGGAVIQSKTVPVTIGILTPKPAITLTGTLAFADSVAGDTLVKVQPMSAQNTGINPSTLTWGNVITPDAGIAGKVSMLPVSGTLAYGATDAINVSFDPTGVAAGAYAATVQIKETVISGVTPKSLNASMTVVAHYTGALKMIASGGYFPFSADILFISTSNRTWSHPLGGGSGRIWMSIPINGGQATLVARATTGAMGAVANVVGLAFRASDGYPSGSGTVVQPGGGTYAVVFGPTVF